jgi:PadR family transcriptional regulator AphA
MARELSPTAYVVLGLVSIRPGGGHEVAAFAQRSIAAFFPLTRSHVFSELAKLEQRGLLDSTEVPQDRLPTKRVYTTTDEGEAVLRRWLEESAIGVDRQRNAFLVRIFFADRMSPDRVASLLDDYEMASRARRDHLGEVVDRLADRPQSVYPRATAMFGARMEQAKLDWIVDVRPLLLDAASAATGQI